MQRVGQNGTQIRFITSFNLLNVHLLPTKGSVLDIGCANGIHVPLFLGIGRSLKYSGIDISKSFIKIAKRRYPHLTFVQGDITKRESLPRKKFDGFFAAAVLMHVPIETWDTMFHNIESLCKRNAIGYCALPIAHPSGTKANEDARHFTLMDENAHEQYFKKMQWKILHKGSMDGSTQEDVWRWYIVRLP